MSSTETPARRSSGAAASLKARERFECRSLTCEAATPRRQARAAGVCSRPKSGVCGRMRGRMRAGGGAGEARVAAGWRRWRRSLPCGQRARGDRPHREPEQPRPLPLAARRQPSEGRVDGVAEAGEEGLQRRGEGGRALGDAGAAAAAGLGGREGGDSRARLSLRCVAVWRGVGLWRASPRPGRPARPGGAERGRGRAVRAWRASACVSGVCVACCGYCMSQSPNERTMASGSAAASSASARSHGSSKPASHAKALSRKPSRITSPRLRGGGPRGRYGPAVALGWTKARLCSAETRWRRRRRRDGSAATNSKAAHLERSVGGRRSKRTQLSE